MNERSALRDGRIDSLALFNKLDALDCQVLSSAAANEGTARPGVFATARWGLILSRAESKGVEKDTRAALAELCCTAVRSLPVRSKPDNDSPPRAYQFYFSQMNLYAFTDSLATIARQANECANGHTTLHVHNGLCLGCLLQAGLTEREDSGSESLDALLS